MKGEKELSKQWNINLKLERLSGRFTEGLHFFKYSPRKILYDEDAMDSFIKERHGEYIKPKRCDMGELISGWAKDKEVHQVSRYQREQKAS